MDKKVRTCMRSFLKAAVVSLAVRGLCPYTAAQWLIQRGRLRDA